MYQLVLAAVFHCWPTGIFTTTVARSGLYRETADWPQEGDSKSELWPGKVSLNVQPLKPPSSVYILTRTLLLFQRYWEGVGGCDCESQTTPTRMSFSVKIVFIYFIIFTFFNGNLEQSLVFHWQLLHARTQAAYKSSECQDGLWR